MHKGKGRTQREGTTIAASIFLCTDAVQEGGEAYVSNAARVLQTRESSFLHATGHRGLQQGQITKCWPLKPQLTTRRSDTASTNGPQENFAVLRHAAACFKP